MKRSLIPILALASLPLAASADYSDAKKSLDSHTPPAWLTTLPVGAPAAPVAKLSGDYAKPPEVTVTPYFTPEAALSGKLAPLAADEANTAKLLGERLSLPELEIIALTRSPRLKAATAELKARRDGYSIAASLKDTLRAYEAYTASSMGEVGGVMKEPGGYPYPGVATLRDEVVKTDVAFGAEKIEEEKAAVLTGLRVAFHELYYLVEARKVEEQRLDLLDMLVSTAEVRYANNVGMLGDVAMIKAEVEKSREMLTTLASERKMREAALLSLLALPQDTILAEPETAPPAPPLPDLGKLRELAQKGNRSVKLMRQDVAKMEAMVGMSEAMTYGRFGESTTALTVNPTVLSPSAGGSMGGDSGPSLAPDAASGAALPMGASFTTDATYLNQTKSRLASAKKALEAEQFSVDAMVFDAWFAFDKATREEALYRDRVTEFTRLALDTNASAYRNGAAPFTLVFATYREWLDSALNAAKSRAEKGVALANLENVTGVSPIIANDGHNREQGK